MLDVYITVDTEIWCDGWGRLEQKFPLAFQQYVYGKTAKGDYALPMTLKLLQDNGLQATFFVEPLFSDRFGLPPLQELVGLLQQGQQDVQLHIHTEWLDEAPKRLFDDIHNKRQFLYMFDAGQQEKILSHGLKLLASAGAGDISAFRAGSYAANLDTLSALDRLGIHVDSSYNPSATDLADSISPRNVFYQPKLIDGVCVYPVSVMDDSRGLRHLQVTACSFAEFKYALDRAEAEGWDSIVIVTHNFEMLDKSKTRADVVVRKRFQKLCEYLGQNSQRFNVKAMSDAAVRSYTGDAKLIRSNVLRTGLRHIEQLSRRFLVG